MKAAVVGVGIGVPTHFFEAVQASLVVFGLPSLHGWPTAAG